MAALRQIGYSIVVFLGLLNPAYGQYQPHFNDEISIYSPLTRNDGCPAGDETFIDGNLYVPQGAPGETFPALIFVPGWGMTKDEYILQAENFATKGYIVLSYSPRGQGESAGEVEVVSPMDIADFCAAVDWLLENTPVDANRIGAYGMSYGGAISLLGLAFDPRIKVVGSASTYGDLENSLYEAETPNYVWMNNLILTGSLRARVADTVFQMRDDLLAGENIDAVREWARIRSPLTYIDIYNQRQTLDLVTGKTVPGVPLYISKNTGDYLFKANRLFELYEKSVGPKKLDTNLGIHSMQEQQGMQLKPNTTWDNLHLWFDYWLQGIDNGVLADPVVSMRVKNWRYRDYFMEWPSGNVSAAHYYFSRDVFGGYLAQYPMESSDSILFSAAQESGASIGVPILTPWLEGAGLQYSINPQNVNLENGIEFVGEPVQETLKIRGTVEVNAWIRSERPEAMVVGYLYALQENGRAVLITHGPASAHNLIPGEPTRLHFEMASVAFDVDPGQQLLVYFDSFEWLYYSPYSDPYTIEFLLGEDYPSGLKIPVRIREEDLPVDEPVANDSDGEGNSSSRGVGGESGSDLPQSTSAGGVTPWLLLIILLLATIRKHQH